MQGLWSQFDRFEPHQVLGMVAEQGPGYSRIARDAGVNGGVQLQHLSRMRAATLAGDSSLESKAASWSSVLRRCAAGGCRTWDSIEPSLGDQTLYTHMCHIEPHLCHRLPCGWNRQLSTRYYTAPGFLQTWHSCASRCHLIHFNQPLLENLVPALQRPGRPPSCVECRGALGTLENQTRLSGSRNPKFTWGASKVYMAQVIEGCCCAHDNLGHVLHPTPVDAPIQKTSKDGPTIR